MLLMLSSNYLDNLVMQKPSSRKVGVFLDFEPSGGGTFQYALSLVNGLAENPGLEVTVAYSQGNWPEAITAKNIRFFKLEGGEWIRLIAWKLMRLRVLPVAFWRRISFLHPFQRVLNKSGVGTWIFPCQDFWSFFLQCPRTVVSIHDLMHRYEPQYEEVRSQIGFREFLYSNICRFADLVLVDSNLGKKHVQESYSCQGLAIEPLPFAAPSYLLGECKQPAGFKFKSGDFFFYPAQFWSHKNHLNLLKALKWAEGKGFRFNLALVGSKKNAAQEIEQFIAEQGLVERVQILGYVPNEEISWLYRNSAGLVMPTSFGPTNIPPLEAISLGVPMAISGIYAMQEQSGDAAIYFDPQKPEEIGESLIKLKDPQVLHTLKAAADLRRDLLSEKVFREKLERIVEKSLI